MYRGVRGNLRIVFVSLPSELVTGSDGRLLEDARCFDSARAAGQRLAGLPGTADIIETPPQA